MDSLWWCVGLIWITLHIHVNGCSETERIALLQIKASINYPNGTSLPYWDDSRNKGSNCCDWEEVQCKNGKVIQLLLNYTRDYKLGYWYLNSSLFLPFRELRYLDLSFLQLAGWVEHEEGFERLLESGKLEVLKLDFNIFNNSILQSLRALSSLKTLSLVHNELNGSIDAQAFLNMSKLEELDLSDNRINSFTGNEGLKSLSKLKILRLGSNSFKNASILQSLGALSSLKELDLGYNELQGLVTEEVFHNMGNLEELDLSGNRINSFMGNEEGLKSLSKLKKLNLNSNSFENVSILQTLGGLSSLKELHLGNNELRGLVTKEGLKGFSDLKELYLDRSSIDMSFFSHVEPVMTSLRVLSLKYINTLNLSLPDKGLDGLRNLEELYLDSSSIDVSFFHNAGVLTSLKVLSLRNITFHSRLPNQGWCELYNLEELDLSDNELSGTLPWCMKNLTSLRVLDLSFNDFSGSIASSPLTSLTSLEYLLLSHNNFVIPISFVSFFNHSKLEVISASKNRLSSDQIVLHSSTPPPPRFQPKVLILSDCELNKFSGTFFRFLYHQHDLRMVDLSHNNLTGGTLFLSWLLVNNTQLDFLRLRNNSFSGPFPLPYHHHHHPYNITTYIDISKNHIHGELPKNIGSIFPSLTFLNMSGNELEGSIPTSLGDLHSLRILDLSHNNLSGQIPQHLAIGCYSLEFFKLSNNNLDGRILPQVVNLTSLRYLYLDNNSFEGKIPDSLSTTSYLFALDISNNNMSGNLPGWIGNMHYLEVLAMSKNHFQGSIPVELCTLDSLSFLDLSNNNLSGSIPSCFNSSGIKHVRLNQNRLSGPLKHAFYNTSYLVTLDFRENNLTGNIPSWIGELYSLSILLLKSNNLEGEIPIQLCHLKELTMLDLSQNNLSGSIPPCFTDIPFKPMVEKSYMSSVYFGMEYIIDLLSYAMGTRLFEMRDLFDLEIYPVMFATQVVEFTTKRSLYAYSGDILDYMSGVDLSCNLLTGEIPSAIGKLSGIHALNLSHNNLIGSIPTTFSMLKQVESLDLSYNNLNGTIPSQLIELYSLAVFSVSHNNLSGRTPEQKAQFATFEESSYEGNPLLCGPPLHNNRCTVTESPSTLPNSSDQGFMDIDVFNVTFTVSFLIAFLGVVAVLYINPYWRRTWFHTIEVYGTSCYYFVLNCFLKLSNKRGV